MHIFRPCNFVIATGKTIIVPLIFFVIIGLYFCIKYNDKIMYQRHQYTNNIYNFKYFHGNSNHTLDSWVEEEFTWHSKHVIWIFFFTFYVFKTYVSMLYSNCDVQVKFDHYTI